MQPPKKNRWKEYRDSLTVAYCFAFFFTIFMPGEWPHRIGTAFVSGFVFGTTFFFVGLGLDRARFRSFWLTCFMRSVVICGVMIAGMAFVLPIAISIGTSGHPAPWNPEVLRVFRTVAPGILITWVPVGFLMSLAVNAIFQVDRKLGPGVLGKWITGRYHNPKEEERIFMFLDLKNSTTLAEKLGNIKFSRLCQEFFRDLSLPVESTKGEVSHYIGDEAVLCWKPKNGLDDSKCLLCFFYMQGAIAKRAAFYEKEFGFVPEFKAGVHIGFVVAAQVGEIKSEIVYHGDVLNTTARITGLCSELHTDLLISGDLCRQLTLPPNLAAESKGMHLLKGKEHEVEVVAVFLKPEQESTIETPDPTPIPAATA
jgi:adenylate cyclase